jgi:Ca-activated chloride channel homolog
MRPARLQFMAAAELSALAVAASLGVVASLDGQAPARGGQEGAQAPVFRVGVQGVRVDVLATRRGAPLPDLAADDFVLLDNGVPQRITSVGHEEIPLSVTLALDVSGSVDRPRLERLAGAATALVRALDARDRATLLTFERRLELLAHHSHDLRAVVEALAALESGGGTSLRDATYAGLALRQPADVRSLLLVFTDGADTASWLDESSVIAAADRADVVVYGVTVPLVGAPEPNPLREDRGPRTVLDLIAEATGGRTMAADWHRLEATFTRIIAEFKSRYLLTFTPEGVEPTGWHRLDVKLKKRRGEIRARRGYLARP